MSDYILSNLDDVRDILALWYYKLAKEIGKMPEAEAVKTAFEASRDKCRTPNQWANAANAGFSPEGVKTWLPVNPNYAEGINAADQEMDPNSMLNFYRRVLAMRRENLALIVGEYQPVKEEAEEYLSYVRLSPDQRCLIVHNMTEQPVVASFDLPVVSAKLMFSTHQRSQTEIDLEAVGLEPFESVVFEIQ